MTWNRRAESHYLAPESLFCDRLTAWLDELEVNLAIGNTFKLPKSGLKLIELPKEVMQL